MASNRTAISSKEVQLMIVGPAESFKASRVQRLTFNADVPNTTINELGSSSHAGITRDNPNVTLSFEAFDTGIKTFAALTGKSSTAYPAEGVDVINLGDFDAIVYVKDPDAATYSKSIHARKLSIQSASFSFSLDGEATESYNANGSEKRTLRYTAFVDKFVSGTTSFTLTQTPLQLKNGKMALSVIVDGVYCDEVTGTPAAGEYKIVGTTLTTGDERTSQVLVVYHANATSGWADVSEPLMPAGVKGNNVQMRIAANDIARVQSITFNATLNATPVKEMGNKSGIAGYQKQNLEVEGTLTVLETDNELINLLTHGVTTLSGVEWGLTEGCATTAVPISVQILDPCDDSAPYTVLKEYYLDSIQLISDSHTAQVNSNFQVSYSFKSTTGHLTVFSGAKP
jgi:hypothetical protein